MNQILHYTLTQSVCSGFCSRTLAAFLSLFAMTLFSSLEATYLQANPSTNTIKTTQKHQKPLNKDLKTSKTLKQTLKQTLKTTSQLTKQTKHLTFSLPADRWHLARHAAAAPPSPRRPRGPAAARGGRQGPRWGGGAAAGSDARCGSTWVNYAPLLFFDVQMWSIYIYIIYIYCVELDVFQIGLLMVLRGMCLFLVGFYCWRC